jgi:hypothetical protein
MFEGIDPYIRDIERFLKIPDGTTSFQLIPEIVARIVELPIDTIMTDITAAKIAKGVLGLFFALAPQHIGPMLSRDWKPRDTEDTYAMAKFWLLETTDPTPDDLIKIASAIQNLRQGFAFGDTRRIASVFGVKSLAAIQADWANVANAFGSAFGIPGAKAPPRPGTPPPMFRETLSGDQSPAAPPGQPAPTAMPGVAQMFRFTSDHAQPGPPTVSTTRFRLTVG